MATQKSFVAYAADQMAGAGAIRTRAMFGEYGYYCDEVFCGVICNDTLFVKPTDAGRAFAPDLELVPAYRDAMPSLRIPEEKLDDAEWLAELIGITRDALPKTKPKRRKR